MSGGKGGSQTTSVQVPAWLEGAARDNIAKANEIGKVGYTPYYGPDVAGFSPMQEAAFQNAGSAAAAFGMAAPSDAMGGMPAPTSYAGGVRGYSSAPMFEDALAALASARPGQFAALNAPFINPVTGAQPAAPFGAGGQMTTAEAIPAAPQLGGGSSGGGGDRTPMLRGSGTGSFGLPDPMSGNIASLGPIGRSGGGMGRGK